MADPIGHLRFPVKPGMKAVCHFEEQSDEKSEGKIIIKSIVIFNIFSIFAADFDKESETEIKV